MLCLSRYTNESIVIDDGIKVTILGVKGNQVRLGIEAPKDLSVHRQEVHDRITAALSAVESPSKRR